jgi:GNAT superfamily N-acetyltransferase
VTAVDAVNAGTPTIEPVVADDRAVMDDWLALRTAARAHDTPQLPPPCPLEHAAQFSWPDWAVQAWVVRRDAGRVVGAADLSLPTRDNLGNSFGNVVVAPDHRRRGLGTRLWQHLVEQARAAGRVRIGASAVDPLDGTGPGSAFLRGTGARLGLTEVRRRLVLPLPDPQAPARLAEQAEAASAGYRIVQWVGATPPRWRDDVAALSARMSTDAPFGELTVEAAEWDGERLRAREEAAAASGARQVVTAAEGPDGHLAAFTVLYTCVAQPGYADQGDTLVAPAHRGRRLGLRIKVANLELLLRERPEVCAVDTYNAAENRFMVAINDALGFVPLCRQGDSELAL